MGEEIEGLCRITQCTLASQAVAGGYDTESEPIVKSGNRVQFSASSVIFKILENDFQHAPYGLQRSHKKEGPIGWILPNPWHGQ